MFLKQRGSGSGSGSGSSSSSSSGCDAEVDSLYLSSRFTADKVEVADILLQLPELIEKSQHIHRFPACWGAKRRRSAIDAPRPQLSDSSELPSVNGKVEYVSTSPTSPLAFSSHTDFDCKHVLPNKELVPAGSKTRKNELLKDCERLTESRDQPQGEAKRMEIMLDRLMAENMNFPETRQLMDRCGTSISGPLELQLMSQSQPSAPPVPHTNHHQLPSGILQFPDMGPRGIPDLNVPAEEYDTEMECPQPSDVEYNHYMAAAAKARAEAAALARQNRLLIQKSRRVIRGNR